jgi:predicted membrane protein
MEAMHRILSYRLTTRDKAGRLAQMACYIAAIATLAMGFYKLNTLAAGLSEAELFFGILLVLALGLLMICLGTLTRIAAMWTHAHAIRLQIEEDEAAAAQA